MKGPIDAPMQSRYFFFLFPVVRIQGPSTGSPLPADSIHIVVIKYYGCLYLDVLYIKYCTFHKEKHHKALYTKERFCILEMHFYQTLTVKQLTTF